jgi:hypothetical protein
VQNLDTLYHPQTVVVRKEQGNKHLQPLGHPGLEENLIILSAFYVTLMSLGNQNFSGLGIPS